MGKDKFEQYVHAMLQNHKIPLNTEEIWAGIEQTLPRKSGGKTWLLGLSGIALLVIGGLLWFQMDTAPAESKEAEQSQQAIAQSLSGHRETSAPDNKEGIAIALDQEDEASLSHTLTTESGLSHNSTTALSYSKTNQKQAIPDANATADHRASNKQNNNLNIVELERGAAVDSDQNNVQESAITLTFPQAGVSLSSTSHSELVESSHVMGPEATRAAFIPTNYLKNTTGTTGTSLLTEDFLSGIRMPDLNDCYSFNGRSFGLAIDFYSGVNYAAKELKSQGTEPAGSEYIRSRKNTENYLEAFEAGINLNLIHRSGFMASTGINYSQIDEEFNYFSVNNETIFDSVLVRVIIDSTGMADSIREWRPTYVQSIREVLTYNYFRSVDIPIALGYQFHHGKWTIEAQGGLLFNLLFKKEGQILDTSLSEVAIDENTSLFRDRLGMTTFASLKAIYPVTDRLSLYAEPFGRFHLKSITVSEYALSQKYNQIGLRFGARFTI